MRELINLRKKREKHFLNPDGTITCHVYDKDIHYLKNGIYEEIDNTLVDIGDHYENKSNSFRTLFTKNSNDLVNVRKDEHYLKMYLNTEDILHLDKINENIKYKNLKNNIDFDYKILSSKLKESIILNCRETVPETLEFFVETDLKLNLQENKKISAKSGNEIIFTIDAPFMIDARGNANYCVDYEVKEKSGGYLLKVILDVEWLKDKDTVFPVTVDPTIINGSGENVYDTYITSLEPNTIRNNLSMLKVGTESDGDINRILLKFALPTIGTSYNIVNARAYLNAYDTMIYVWTNEERAVNVHAINTEWDETTATWANMNDKYDSHIETFFYPVRHDIGETDVITPSEFEITNLVKKWYSGTANNGIMLKWNNETYAENANTYLAYSKTHDYNNETGLRPYLTITYMYQNGISSYMDYNKVQFNNGCTYINSFNGNVTNIFGLNKTLYGKLPINLNLVYNTCDAVLDTFNNIGKGYKFNFEETIKEVVIDSVNYLEYIDEDSSIHYLIYSDEGYYVDEEGLNLKVSLINGEYEVSDSEGNKKKFAKIGNVYYLTKIIDLDNNEIVITYENNKIIKIMSSVNEEINITYSDSQIIIASDYDTSKIVISNSNIGAIETKMGITRFEYNTNNIISKITDMNDTYITYEYYTNPYKLKKITHYGTNNSVGKFLNFTYNYNATTIVDDKNMKKTISFDNLGRTIGTILIDNNTKELKDSYGYSEQYIDNPFSTINNYNVVSNSVPIKYVKNLLQNSSFEPSNVVYNFDTGLGYTVNDYARTGAYSLKFYETNTFEYSITETGMYTFSFYIKKTCDGVATLNKKIDDDVVTIITKKLSDFNYNVYTRYSVTGYFEAGSTLSLKIDIDEGTYAYIDDVQLEEGQVANHYNMINNSDFSSGVSDWEVPEDSNSYEIVTLESGEKAIKLTSNPEGEISLSKYFNVSGSAGDVYTLSFWYKNEGVYDYVDTYVGNVINLQFFNVEEDMGTGTWNTPLQRHSKEWQFFTEVFVAEADYSDFNLNILSIFEANSIYLTNFMLIKNLGRAGYQYDENGNLIWESDLAENVKQHKYDSNNQLVASFTPKGNNFVYEYDNAVKDRILKGISPTGISNEYDYDEYGNVIKTTINNVNSSSTIVDGSNYRIRLKGTKKYLSYDFTSNIAVAKENNCNHMTFTLIKEGDLFRIKYGNLNLTLNDSTLIIKRDLSDSSLFFLEKNDNGSYLIIPKNNTNLSLTFQNNSLTFTSKEIDSVSQQFYFENNNSDKKIIRKAEYDETGKYILKEFDELGKVTVYDIDSATGLNKSKTFANGNKIVYTYDSEEKLVKQKLLKREKNYEYNNNNLLSKIVSGNKSISFLYDEFYRPQSVKINNNEIINNVYNIDNLHKKIFGNGHEIIYTHDSFNRVKNVVKNNKTYSYYYNNLSSLSKVEALGELYEYNYDYAERLKEFTFNEILKLNYLYDSNGNIIEKNIKFDDKDYNIRFSFNKDDNATKVTIDNTLGFYNNYDELGRLISTHIDNKVPCEYTYYSNGDNTSLVLKSIKINNDFYSYKYDELYNIIEILLNDNIIKSYKYDEINELIQEFDYEKNKKFKYEYDLYGNITSVKTFNLNDEFIGEEKYEYNNEAWNDQLTKYNDQFISYDGVGNILNIGSKNFTWIDGTKLKSFSDSQKNINISYEYDNNGALLKKTKGNIITEYYYEDGLLIFEKNNNNVIYYIYDNNDNLIGFKQNNNVFFYKKNHLEDIIGIYDSNYNQVVWYEYDSWGNTIIKDANGNYISDVNNIGYINSFRYRSYYYDNDIEMYFLHTRYYYPTIRRFINIDCQISNDFIGDNLYVYCGNNPINRKDDNGKAWLAAAIIGAVVGGAIKVTSNLIQKKKPWDGLAGAMIGGAVGGIIGVHSATLGIIGGAAIESTTNEIISYTPLEKVTTKNKQKKVTKKNVIKSVANIGTDVVISTGLSVMGGELSGTLAKKLFNITDVGRPAKSLVKQLFGKKALKNIGVDFVSGAYSELVSSLMGYTQEKTQFSIFELFS